MLATTRYKLGLNNSTWREDAATAPPRQGVDLDSLGFSMTSEERPKLAITTVPMTLGLKKAAPHSGSAALADVRRIAHETPHSTTARNSKARAAKDAGPNGDWIRLVMA